MTQSTAHEKALHVTVDSVEGHPTPPCAWLVMMERNLRLEPEPQVFVHASYFDQPETLQSVGQAKVLQSALTERVRHTTPPWATSVMMERDLVLVPNPQVLVHDPYPDHPETTQLTGQAKVLQAEVNVILGHLSPSEFI
jgi:hypothetical protein